MSLDRSVTINLGGKERKIKFNALGVSQLERMLDDHNVYKMVNGGVVALGDLAKCLYVGLAAYDKKVTIQQVYNWMDEWLLDNSSESLQTLVIIALSKAGVFGLPGRCWKLKIIRWKLKRHLMKKKRGSNEKLYRTAG